MSLIIAERFQRTLDTIKFRDWTFKLDAKAGSFYLQCCFSADGQEWTGRKWLLSEHMTRSEIVQTAFKAVLTAVEHEAREHFLYDGRPIFGPHIDIERLWETCESLDIRPPKQNANALAK